MNKLLWIILFLLIVVIFQLADVQETLKNVDWDSRNILAKVTH